LLAERSVAYHYRDYRKEPLTVAELKRVVRLLGVPARTLLRKNDAAYKALGLKGTESDAALFPLLAKHPTLLARPIGISGAKAVVGRPPERLLELAR